MDLPMFHYSSTFYFVFLAVTDRRTAYCTSIVPPAGKFLEQFFVERLTLVQ